MLPTSHSSMLSVLPKVAPITATVSTSSGLPHAVLSYVRLSNCNRTTGAGKIPAKSITKYLAMSLLAIGCAQSAQAEAIPSPSMNSAQSELVRNGAYVARVADCMSCHGEDYAGGLGIDTPMGKVYATNITPSIQYGIGSYTEQDFRDALLNGRTPTHRLYPAMPYPSYSGMSDADLNALFSYFSTVPPVERPLEQKTQLRFPFNIRPLMIGWNVINKPNWQPREGLNETQLRGQYIVDNLEHCGACHTPRTATMGTDFSKYLTSPNITPDVESGIGSWSEEQIVTFLRHGEIEQKAFAGGPMGEVVMHSTRYVSDDDLAAVASYLKALPPVRVEDTIYPVNELALPVRSSDTISFDILEQMDRLEQAHTQATSEAESLYLTNCASCHGVNGYGQPDAGYPSIVGVVMTRRENPGHLIDIIANGLPGPAATRPAMPGFSDDLTAEQIAAVTNYVRVNFGTLPDSQVTPADVTTRMNSSEGSFFLINNAAWLFVLGVVVALLLLWLLIRWLMRSSRKDRHTQKSAPRRVD